MLVDQMHSSLLPGQTRLVAILNKASVRLLPTFFSSISDRIVILGDMKIQEVFRRKVLAAVRAAVDVVFLVVDIMLFVTGEGLQRVRRQRAVDHAFGCFLRFDVSVLA